MDDIPPEVVQRAERQVNAVLAKVIGGVMLWIGVAAFGLLVWASYKLMLLDRRPEFGAFVLLDVFAIIGTYCALVGWRLFLNRPNRFGSILGPVGWRILGGTFGLSAIAFLIFAVALLRDVNASQDILAITVTSVASCAVFSHWCFLSARRVASTAANTNGAL